MFLELFTVSQPSQWVLPNHVLQANILLNTLLSRYQTDLAKVSFTRLMIQFKIKIQVSFYHKN